MKKKPDRKLKKLKFQQNYKIISLTNLFQQYMDEKLNIYYHIKKEMSKAMQGMDVIGKLKQSTSSVFVRLDLDYGEKK